jgi:hypothetical protein
VGFNSIRHADVALSNALENETLSESVCQLLTDFSQTLCCRQQDSSVYSRTEFNIRTKDVTTCAFQGLKQRRALSVLSYVYSSTPVVRYKQSAWE